MRATIWTVAKVSIVSSSGTAALAGGAVGGRRAWSASKDDDHFSRNSRGLEADGWWRGLVGGLVVEW